MNLQQLQLVHETVKQRFVLRDVAVAHAFTPNNVRRHIKDFEAELGLEVFERRGKFISGLTPAGRDLMEVIERIQMNIDRLRMLNPEKARADARQLRIGSTYTEARYVLPPLIRAFQDSIPNVRLDLRIGSLSEITDLLNGADVDLGLGCEFQGPLPDHSFLKGFDWPLVLIVPEKHPLTRMEKVTLEALAAFPLITWHQGIPGRRTIDTVFAAAGIAADIVLAAGSDDIIMTYVELGLGVGILAPMAFDPHRDRELRLLDASHIFGRMATRLCLRRGHALTEYVQKVLERIWA